MTATKQQVVKATLNFSVQFNVSVQATEAKWKRLTKDHRDPAEKWEDEGAFAIESFCEDLAEPLLSKHFQERLIGDPVWDSIEVKGLTGSEVQVQCLDFDGVELEEGDE